MAEREKERFLFLGALVTLRHMTQVVAGSVLRCSEYLHYLVTMAPVNRWDILSRKKWA